MPAWLPVCLPALPCAVAVAVAVACAGAVWFQQLPFIIIHAKAAPCHFVSRADHKAGSPEVLPFLSHELRCPNLVGAERCVLRTQPVRKLCSERGSAVRTQNAARTLAERRTQSERSFLHSAKCKSSECSCVLQNAAVVVVVVRNEGLAPRALPSQSHFSPVSYPLSALRTQTVF